MRTFVRVAVTLSIVFGLSSAAAGQGGPSSFNVTVSGRGPSIVLIPGLLSTGEVWSSTVERYQKHYTLHTVTLAGFGGPPPIGPPFLSHVRDELIAYMRDLPQRRVRMAATRHFIMLDDPSMLFAAIDEFLASLPKRE